MVCLCDISLFSISPNLETYGGYSVELSKRVDYSKID